MLSILLHVLLPKNRCYSVLKVNWRYNHRIDLFDRIKLIILYLCVPVMCWLQIESRESHKVSNVSLKEMTLDETRRLCGTTIAVRSITLTTTITLTTAIIIIIVCVDSIHTCHSSAHQWHRNSVEKVLTVSEQNMC